jgi:hypothetical protein
MGQFKPQLPLNTFRGCIGVQEASYSYHLFSLGGSRNHCILANDTVTDLCYSHKVAPRQEHKLLSPSGVNASG